MPQQQFAHLKNSMTLGGSSYDFFDPTLMEDHRYEKLPYSIRILLESAIRNCDNFTFKFSDVENLLDWSAHKENVEVPFRPARIILQESTGLPAVVDLAAMRDAVKSLGGDPQKINPFCPAELIIDHAIHVDYFGEQTSILKNEKLEFERNAERFKFLKWGASSFENFSIIPPGSGVMHEINMEYLARIVFSEKGLLYPDTVIGADSHTPMVSGMGVLAWGVGGIEAEAVILGQSMSLVLPEVIGVKLTGRLPQNTTATDLGLTLLHILREVGVVDKFVEFFGPAVRALSIPERGTICNLGPEHGATVTLFPIDENVIEYLRETGRDESKIDLIEKYLKQMKMFQNHDAERQPSYTKIIELKLDSIVPSVSGPKRPNDLVPVVDLKSDFSKSLTAKVSFKGFGLNEGHRKDLAFFEFKGEKFTLQHGSVVLASICSGTNAGNPWVMLGAGLLAKRAVEKGLKVNPYIKTSLSPASLVVKKFLDHSNLLQYLEKLGFFIAGYECMTCIGNSGPLPDVVAKAIEENNLVVASVTSANRNFEGRLHPSTRANYLASPLYVLAYALAGRIDIDFETEPLGMDLNKNLIYLRDIFPSRNEIGELVKKHVNRTMFAETYKNIFAGSTAWQNLTFTKSLNFNWDQKSSYIKKPPFFDGMTLSLPKPAKISNAYCLLNLGDSITTDHISPGSSIPQSTPAAQYLMEKGVSIKDFNTYASRRSHDEIVARGCFANIRLINKLMNGKVGSKTIHIPSRTEMSIFEAAMRYKEEKQQILILAGKEYGCGSSRDSAAKGPFLLGVKAVLAESFERIHRSNLVGMGLLPLQYLPGQNANSLNLSGQERYSILMPGQTSTFQKVQVETDTGKSFEAVCRLDTEVELEYYKHGGVLQYMVRKMI